VKTADFYAVLVINLCLLILWLLVRASPCLSDMGWQHAGLCFCKHSSIAFCPRLWLYCL